MSKESAQAQARNDFRKGQQPSANSNWHHSDREAYDAEYQRQKQAQANKKNGK